VERKKKGEKIEAKVSSTKKMKTIKYNKKDFAHDILNCYLS